MKSIDGVKIYNQDIRDSKSMNEIFSEKNITLDLVLSDIAPNITGIGITDTQNMIELLNIEIYLINKYLVKGGSFLAKCFQGNSFDHLKKFMKNNFDEVIRFKPEASRKSSKECYLLGKFKK